MLLTRDLLELEKHIQTESEQMKKRFSMQIEIKRELK